MSDRRQPVDIAETDQIGLSGSGRAVSIAAWALSAFVIAAGIVALVLTGKKVFIVFIVLGILTPLNVLMYDTFVLKPKIAKLKRERAEQRAADDAAKETDQ
ncbi:hypothetical protein [Cumulibacter manganitolerans]|uniref:hypothetical protein n=1 Tax=Cumulibacter manganitolerans TaxID=1884992 RepID=UPI0012955791|nr:hypothetical protein [Cumulibacter manganitolerans]